MSIPPITILVFSILVAVAIIVYVIISSRKQKTIKPDSTIQPVQRKSFPIWGAILIAIAVTPVLYILISQTEIGQEIINPKPILQIVKFEWVDEKGNYNYIRGSVKNTSDLTVSYFSVIADYLDSKGNILDSDYTNDGLDLLPGAERRFEIMHPDNSAYSKVQVKIGKVRFE